MNLHDMIVVLFVQGGDDAENESTQTDEQLLLKAQDVLIDQIQKLFLDLKIGGLVEIV